MFVTLLFLLPTSAADEAAVALALAKAARQRDRTPVAVSAATSVPAPVVRFPARTMPYQSPPGFHRHVRIDGTVIEHHDSNLGDPRAHQGIASPWPKYWGPLPPAAQQQRTAPPVQWSMPMRSNCPPGVH
jgi:hypothetical protein